MFDLKGFGIPKLISFGKNSFYNILVEELLGLSLINLWDFKRKKNIKIKNACMIALQALDRLEYIHSKNVIHTDIKPENFLIGRKNKEIIYLIDFGFARKYRSSGTGKHIKYKNIKFFYGSMLFSSLNGDKGYELSRKDDLESLGYMLIYLALHHLPWLDLCKSKTITNFVKFKLMSEMKSSITKEKLFNSLPEEFTLFIKYCRNLGFDQEPNYGYLRSLFAGILTRDFQKNDLFFFWVIKKDTIKNSNSENISPIRRKSNPKKILFNRIKQSLEKKKNYKRENSKNNRLILEHRDTITISSIDYKVRKSTINKNNKNISKFQSPSLKVLNNKNNYIKLNTKDKVNNKQIYKYKQIIYRNNRNFINNQREEESIQLPISKKNSFNIIFDNDIYYRNFNFININDTMNSMNSSKKNILALNNSIKNIKNECLRNIVRIKKISNKNKEINHFNIDSFNQNVNHTNYRTLNERQKIYLKYTNQSIIQNFIKITKNINSKNKSILIKKKSQFTLYNSKYANSHNKFCTKNIINNNISMVNKNYNSLSFKK